MDVSGVLKAAWAAVEEAELPDAVQLTAFEAAVRLLMPQPVTPASGATALAPERRELADDGSSDVGGAGVTEDVLYERVVSQTGVERSRLEQVVHLDDDGPRVTLPGLKLGRNNAERTRAVAQILTVVRGFGLEEVETPLDVVRAECSRLKVYDSANFSAHVSKIAGYVVTGSGSNRRIRVKGAGIEAFPSLVNVLVDG